MKIFLLVACWLLATSNASAATIVSDFKFDATSPYSIGTLPLTAAFNGGDAALPADPALLGSETHA